MKNKTKSIKLETPIGSIESDSGNHAVDIGTIILFIALILCIYKYIKKF
tara:strand:- start:992 stop:1138 length:147 start_codon:yes stop_codon:yes gene_type:complete